MYSIQPKVTAGPIAGIISGIDRQVGKNVLLLSSPSVIRISTVQALLSGLEKEFALTVFSEIEPNAPVGTLDCLVHENDKPDLIIAIGGGSVIDSAKALSVGWQGKSISDLFYKKADIGTEKIEVIAVPTTAGSGAELSYGAILFDKTNNYKGGLRSPLLQPDQVFIDVDLYKEAPIHLIAETGFDCMTHAIETYLSKKSTPLVRYQSVAAINATLTHLEEAVAKNIWALEQMAIASAMMGINLALSSTCLPHRLQYVLGPHTRTSHAQGLIMLYRGWLPLVSKTSEFRMLELALGLRQGELVARIGALKQQLDIDYRAGDFGLTEAEIPSLLDKVDGILDVDPCYSSKQTLENIMKGSL